MSSLALLAAAVVATAAPQPADFGPTWSPGGLQLAYSHTDNDASQTAPVLLLTLNLDGSPGRALVHPTGTGDQGFQAADASWAPDGRQIAYTFTDGLHDPESTSVSAVNLDGTSSHLSVPGLEPDWAPDSTRLVYGTFGDLWTMARDGSEKRRLTSTSAFELEPAWSRDRTRIAYVRDDAVWTMQADGTGQSRVGPGSEPFWGPQGLAYVRAGRVVSGARRITPAGLIATGPAFSRDATKLAFAGDVTDCEQPGLFVADADGSHLKRLTGRDCRIFGTPRSDTIVGTPRRDVIDARAGRDHVRAGAGADDVHARDGARDTIACGRGPDTVFADRLDVVAGDCEDVRRP